jgi:hypothetical protein
MLHFTKKRAVIGAAIATLAMGAVAFAFFTSTGAGSGSATVGSASAITLAGTITGDLYPAGAPASVSVLVTNPGSGSQHVGDVHLASITADAAHTTAGCDVSVGSGAAFTMGDIPLDAVLTKTGTAGDHTTVSGSLQMNDTGVSQNNCQGATLTLHFTSAA